MKKYIKKILLKKHQIISIFFLAAFTSSALIIYTPKYNWHNQQRVMQLFFVATCSIYYLLKIKKIEFNGLSSIAFIFSLGLVSCVLSSQTAWALKEWALYLGLFLTILATYHLSKKHKALYESVFYIALITGFLLASQFIIYYTSAFISGVKNLDPGLLFPGFDNPRFLAQFQIILIPLLASLHPHLKTQSQTLGNAILATLTVHWCIAYTLGGRGFFAGIFFANLIACLIIRSEKKVIITQLKTAIIGFLLYACLLKIIPWILGVSNTENWGYSPLRADLTGRGTLWKSAWESALSHPFFGLGPMGLASNPNTIAAHPHQALLQWLAEWGAPATMATCILTISAGYHYIAALKKRTPGNLEKGAIVALLGAVALSQVDGVVVMPYIQTWLALLVGVLMAKHPQEPEPPPRKNLIRIIKAYALFSVIIITKIIILEAPTVPESEEHYYKIHIDGPKPRFWSQGWTTEPHQTQQSEANHGYKNTQD